MNTNVNEVLVNMFLETKGFAQEQLPDVANQILQWEAFKSMGFTISCGVMFVIFLLFALLLWKSFLNNRSSEDGCWALAFSIVGLIMSLLFATSEYIKYVKVTKYPKAFMTQYIIDKVQGK